MIVYLLTEEQKQQIEGKVFAQDSFFQPIEDANGNWVITSQEVLKADCEDILWIKNLPTIEYVKREIEDLHIW